MSASAAVMAVGYVLDTFALPMHPALLAAVAVVAGAAAFTCIHLETAARSAALLVALAWAYSLWIAWPALLPVTNGPDVVHHLQLIHFISTTGHLPHDPALGIYLLEMMGYTPGSHILAAAAGAWFHVDPLRVVYPLAALFFALQAGLLYVIARQLLPPHSVAPLTALAAPLLALVPAAYSLGAFVHFFYFGQVISQTFAIGVLLAAVSLSRSMTAGALFLAAACGAGVALAWPVWLGPSLTTMAFVAVAGPASTTERLKALSTLAPAALVIGWHRLRHPSAASIVTSTGAVTAPSLGVFGFGFVLLAVAGSVFALRDRRARPVAVFLAATLAQSVALAVLARRGGAPSFYMAFKTMYLTVPAAAILGAIAAGHVAAALSTHLPRAQWTGPALALVTAVALVWGRIPGRPMHAWISIPARDAGVWARQNVPPGCVDYFSTYWLTAYWLHLDVLGNPRVSARMSGETFEFRDAAAKWIEGRGLPFAIVEHLDAMPRDVRGDMDVLHQDGAFAVVRNRRPASCE